jgi:hypothetical protein
MIFVLFLTLLYGILFIPLFVQSMSLCAQHSSRPFTDWFSVNSSLLFYFFDIIFEMHSQSSSANFSRLSNSGIMQDHPEKFGSLVLLTTVLGRWSFFALYIGCYLSFLFFFLFLWFIIFLAFVDKQAASRGKNRPPRSRPIALSTTVRTRDKEDHLLVCMLVFWSSKKKKNNLTQVGAPSHYIFPVYFYTIIRNNLKRCERLHMKGSVNWNKKCLFKVLIWQSRRIYNVDQNIIFLSARKLQQPDLIGGTGPATP